MKFINYIISLYKIGGFSLLKCKLTDKIFGEKNTNQYIYNICKTAKCSEYPKLLKEIYRMSTNEKLDLDHPKSYNEKIQWLKIYDTTSLKTELSDKVLVRDWIEKKIGSKYLIPLLGTWNSFEKIDLESLPESFVLKCNHGSGWNLVVKNKESFDVDKAKKLFDRWMNTNFAFSLGFELQYKNIKPQILAEKYIDAIDSSLYDYKIHVFNGIPRIIQVIGNRNMQNHTAQEVFYDVDWNQIDLMYHTYGTFKILPPKPDNLSEMLYIASELGKDFKYVRVDLYNVSNHILFGEMTFTPMSGFGKWKNAENALLVGSWISIP